MATRTITENLDVYEGGRYVTRSVTREQRIIDELHCQQCGRSDYESLETGDQGYTACCNEIAILDCDPRDCSHD